MSSPSATTDTAVPERPPFSEAATLPRLTPEYIKALYPDYMELVQAQVFFRHGERTPVANSITKKGQWAFCERANYLHAEFMKAIGRFVPREEALPAPNPDRIGSGTADSRYTEKTATLKSGVEYEPAQWHVRLSDDGSTKKIDGNAAGSSDGKKAKGSEMWSPASCDMGQLSDIGLESLFRTGSFLRSLYVDKLRFLPAVPEGNLSDWMYIRTTDYSRVIQSTHALLVGLYPGYPASAWNGRWTVFNSDFLRLFPIHTRLHRFETMHGNFGCYEFLRNFMDTTSEVARRYKWIDDVYKQTVALESIGKQAAEIIDKPAFGSNFHPVYDELSAMKGHGMPLPADITADYLNRLGEVAHHQWSHVMNFTKAQRLGFGRLVDNVVQTMAQAAELDQHRDPWYRRLLGAAGKPAIGPQRTGDLLLGPDGVREETEAEIPRVPKIALYGGHDITVGPLSMIMGNQSEEWVPFASMLTFEMFKDKSADVEAKSLKRDLPRPATLHRNIDTDGYFVRVKLNDRVLQVPTCEMSGKHHPKMGSSMCTLAAFFEHVAPIIATEGDYKNECGIFPKKD
ncbi:phosphoglycerate mutase-like protein [Martensiomyces pterosporus]|nr:phosphoglycerate mutase-like protein [Martensiomyces pterosporus]